MRNFKNIRTEAKLVETADLTEWTEYQDDEISVEQTIVEDVYYVTVSTDGGLSFEFDGCYKYEN